MRRLINIGLLLFLQSACSDNSQPNSPETTEKNILTNDTVIGSKTITDEIDGSAFTQKATSYFVVVGKDTSDFTCIFNKLKEGEGGDVRMNIRFEKATVTYRQRLIELKIILSIAAKDYKFDSLTTISLGRLVLSGDLAIDITNQYRQKFGTNDKINVENHRIVEEFLAKSKLGVDIDSLFKPYSISVDKVSIEKLFFTTKKDLYSVSKIETASANTPDKILDCMIWVKLKKK